MRYCAAIFDLDGVIVNTSVYHYKAWKKIAEKLGFTLTLQQNELLKGVSRMASLDIIEKLSGKKLTRSKKVQLADEKNQQYIQSVSHITSDDLLPGVEDCFRIIKQQGAKIVLGSASKNALLVLHHLGIEQMFDAIIDGKQVKKAKPDPEVFLKGAQACKTHPNNCVVFEDSAAGIQAANAAGMFSVFVGEPNPLVRANYTANRLNDSKIYELFQ